MLAGKPQTASEEVYFNEQVKPLFDGRSVIYRGEVSQAQKSDFLGNASALLLPIEWEEPVGLVMIEAMACGTPVVACRRGSVPEVVDSGKTGFYANSVDELASLIPCALGLNRRTVWEHARGRFNHFRMVDDYVDAFETLVLGASVTRA
jgi:glycosyltransferase involved in cell wall biosynthesis